MKRTLLIITGLIASFAFGFYINTIFAQQQKNNNSTNTKTEKHNNMKLGAFSKTSTEKSI